MTLSNDLDISVVICTYNRSDMLSEALESVLSQDAGSVRYEFIVVDNNSKDRTREVVNSFVERSHGRVRYIFEEKQGVANARNTGYMSAHAPIVAFTDDDVRVADDWVRKIKQTFDEHPEVDFVGGKVLPRWNAEPPAWLTRDHWSPLAIQDYSDKPFYSNAANPICFVAANLAIRRDLFAQVGGFDPAFQRIGASSAEDHEWQLRVWKAGKQGLFVPEIVVTADVQVERLSKAYHRLWHTGHGISCAMMRDPSYEPASARLFDVPAHLFRQAAQHGLGWVKNSVQRRESEAFSNEVQLRSLISFFRHRRRDHLGGRGRSTTNEVVEFVRSLIEKKAKYITPRDHQP
jgi:glycosyltransferase involved in cell wall biosynthesis